MEILLKTDVTAKSQFLLIIILLILRKFILVLRKKLLVLRIFFLKTSNVRIVSHFGLPRIFLKQEVFFLKQE